MSRERLRVNLMTAGFTPGDAISNYIQTLARILRGWGARVEIYADAIASELHTVAQPSHLYQPTGRDLLWFHYSIYADNIERALASPDYTFMDYHGVCPPRLFHDQNPHLEFLCQRGLDLLPSMAGRFDQVIFHSEDSRRELLAAGFAPETMHKFYHTVDTTRLAGAADRELSALLSKLTYFLLVGRIVPQKDVAAAIELFARVHRARPDAFLFLVGTRDQAKGYQRELDGLVARHGLQERVVFTEQVSNPAVLAALYQHATMLIVTSEWESFCIPIAESLYFSVPAAVHDQEPMTEIAGPGGLIFDKRQPDEAARSLVALLDDPASYAALSAAARAQAGHYTDAALAANVLAFLRRVFPSGGSPA